MCKGQLSPGDTIFPADIGVPQRKRKSRFHNQDCTFLQNPQSRKRKPTIELDDLEPDAKRRPSASSVRSKKSPGTQGRIIRTTNGTGVEEYDDLDGPSLLKKTLGLQNKHHSRYVGATSSLEPALLGETGLPGVDEIQLTGSTLRRVSSKEAFTLLPDPETQGYSDELDDLDAIESIVKPHGKSLIDLYFRIVFPSFPILHKEVYLEKYSRSYREFSPPLLGAVYLLALQYWTYDDRLSSLTKPNVQKLEELARKALRDTIHRPKLSTVQAGLLLLQHTDTDSAELTAQLVSVAYGLGLHLDATDWNIPDWEKGLRKRLGWGLYMQDKWSSMGSGRPPLINSSNWILRAVVDSDFPENAAHEDDQEGSSEVEKGRILFAHMISLSQILADLLENVFTVRATREIASAGDGGLDIVLGKVKPIQLKLKEWYTSLPECLTMNSTRAMKLSSVGYLRLAYFATEISLHRRILLAVSPKTDPQKASVCRSAAQERFNAAIDFVEKLKPQHLLSFWYFASPHNFALIGMFGTLLRATAPNLEEAEHYRTKLKEYRWTLKLNSENGAKFMRPAMAVLDANTDLLESAKAKSQSNPSLNDYTTPEQSDGSASTKMEDYSFPLAQFEPGADYSTPGLYNFGTPYYSGQTPTDMSAATYAANLNTSTRTRNFEYESSADPSLWTFEQLP
ncbi:hypothetical protein BP6252_05168 [Coleophoma cylindrospora]|uniref:Xylanolytic transcriptional activator regulatory domain-containing protein n=1 Tax=Coleophoma cylindrospora TaxID=1849047 RepID=A0A3D8RSZ0_9HELO|nr:hypothetical protein BP6252_05168 [Coleophoma cylindrospora]